MEHCISKRHMYIAFIVLVMCLLFSGGSACADAYPESSHPYANNSSLKLTYTHPTSTDSLLITFSSATEVETNYDYIHITGANGAKQTFTGTELAGKTITVSGNTFTIELTSDGSVTKHGFTITNIIAGKTGFCGKNGSNIAWQLNTETGLLTLTGSGEMADYDYDYEYVDYGPDEEYYTHPWDNYLLP